MNRTLAFSLSYSSKIGRRALNTLRCQPAKRKKNSGMTSSMRLDRTTPETIQVGDYKIYGVSVAAVETCVCIPSLSLAFDAGQSPPGAIPMRYMAITHGHCDHVHGLPLHLATRNLQRLPPPRYFLSPDIEEDVRSLVSAVGRLERSALQADLVSLTPESEPVEFKKGWLLKPFQTFHTVPSQGYVVYKKKKKLKPEYVGLSGAELARMRSDGVKLDQLITTPEIAFTGDTTLEAIAKSEDCKNARILITEMTFLDDKCSSNEARSFGHIHMDEVVQRHSVFQGNEHVVFTHFSARYSRETIAEAIAKLPSPLKEKSTALGVGQLST